jgi:hypothetical protein
MPTTRTSITLLTLAGALLLAVSPELGSGATGAAAAKPTSFTIAVNGKTLTNAQLAAGAETYLSTKVGRTQVAVRWRGDLRGSGYYVVVKDASKYTTRRCTTGTSCVAVWSKTLRATDEMGWTIQIVRTQGNRVVSEKYVCVVGKA